MQSPALRTLIALIVCSLLYAQGSASEDGNDTSALLCSIGLPVAGPPAAKPEMGHISIQLHFSSWTVGTFPRQGFERTLLDAMQSAGASPAGSRLRYDLEDHYPKGCLLLLNITVSEDSWLAGSILQRQLSTPENVFLSEFFGPVEEVPISGQLGHNPDGTSDSENEDAMSGQFRRLQQLPITYHPPPAPPPFCDGVQDPIGCRCSKDRNCETGLVCFSPSRNTPKVCTNPGGGGLDAPPPPPPRPTPPPPSPRPSPPPPRSPPPPSPCSVKPYAYGCPCGTTSDCQAGYECRSLKRGRPPTCLLPLNAPKSIIPKGGEKLAADKQGIQNSTLSTSATSISSGDMEMGAGKPMPPPPTLTADQLKVQITKPKATTTGATIPGSNLKLDVPKPSALMDSSPPGPPQPTYAAAAGMKNREPPPMPLSIETVTEKATAGETNETAQKSDKDSANDSKEEHDAEKQAISQSPPPSPPPPMKEEKPEEEIKDSRSTAEEEALIPMVME